MHLRVNKLANVCKVLLALASLKWAKQGSSSVVSMVCPGDNVTVSCSTNGSALQWRVNISLTPLHFINEGEQGIRIFTAASPETEQPIVINQTVFHFSKISSELSLASVVTIDNVTTSMNLTEIECARQGGLSSTTILIIDYTMVPEVISEESFGANNVAVTLEWFQDGVVFNDVLPPALVRLTGNKSVQLTIPYNIEHDVRFAVCGQPSPEAIKLHYIVCDEPIATDDGLTVINYTAPAREGSIIVIECLLGDLVDTSNHTSTCVDGRWEPTLGQISARCKGLGRINMPAASNHSTLIAIVISVLVLIVIFFTIGFACGCFCHKYKQSILVLCTTSVDPSSSSRNTDSRVKDQESHDLEMTENVAYGPLGRSQPAVL